MADIVTLANAQSGLGLVRNCLLFDNVAKSVVRSPLNAACGSFSVIGFPVSVTSGRLTFGWALERRK